MKCKYCNRVLELDEDGRCTSPGCHKYVENKIKGKKK